MRSKYITVVNNAELVVDEENLRELADYFKTRSTELERMIKQYINHLKKIRINSIQSGRAADGLDGYIEFANGMRNNIPPVGDKLYEVINDFISDVDEKDQYLF